MTMIRSAFLSLSLHPVPKRINVRGLGLPAACRGLMTTTSLAMGNLLTDPGFIRRTRLVPVKTHSLFLCLAFWMSGAVQAAEQAHPGPECCATDTFFADEVWAKVGARNCLKCHKAGGDAEESPFVLLDPARYGDVGDALARNREVFIQMARQKEDGRSRLLRKALGELDHGGDDVLTRDSTRYRILELFVRRIGGDAPSPTAPQADTETSASFFDGILMIDNRRLLRRLTLSLAARLPTPEEQDAVLRGGLEAIEAVLDEVMSEEAFYDRLAEGFNDIFLTTGYDDSAEDALSYEHFEKTRHWYQEWDFSEIADEKERREAGYRLAREYREAMLREPMELVKHIVREGRPFTGIITADYIMVSPYTARGYGIFEEVRERFQNPNDHLEFIPVRLKALQGRSRQTDQDSATGFYPHAGILSTFQYLKRYPTTDTNRNRQRARLYFLQFLGIDIMQLAPRVNDAAAISAQYENPTMQAADCVVCHKVIDPVAGLFQDYFALDGKGVYLRRKGGWFTDMFPPGWEGESLPDEERWRALPWLGERTARDPRFAVAMVEHVWYLLTGRKALLPPEDIDDPLHAARQRAFREQRRELERVAQQFSADGFDLKTVFKKLAHSPFYRADGLASVVETPARRAELEDIGLVRLLSPEQLERKLNALFGSDWGRLHEQFKILYGGIDAKEVTERIADPSGAMGAIQRMMANDIACQHVPRDFALDPAMRRLFPGIEPDVFPEVDHPGAEAGIRAAMVHLHDHILGRYDNPNSAEIDRTYALFTGILEDAHGKGRFEPFEIYACRVDREQRLPDPHYTLRAWRAVVTYLLRQHDFLYE